MDKPSVMRCAGALFLASLAAVLFSLSLFRLISFFIMPSLFFDMLLVCFPIGAAIAIGWLFMPNTPGTIATLAALVVMTTITGNLFPTLFEWQPNERMAIFTLDAIGAAAGSMAAFFVPILFGFPVFHKLALGLFLLTLAVMAAYLNARRHGDSAAVDQRKESGSA